MDLRKLRKEIDRVDKKILNLLNRRAKEVIKVSSVKKKDNLDVYSAEREAGILNGLKKLNSGPLSCEDIDIIFSEILSVCRSLRAALKIAYLGPQGTFTHMAAAKKFGKKQQYVSSESISDVFDKVSRGEVDYGVVPIENSIEGVVNYTLDMFFDSDLQICAEVTLNISHCLLGKRKENIKRIYSNPQVFAQCRAWIGRHYNKAQLIPALSTARAALLAKKDNNGACIGNKILASLYGLNVFASSIEDAMHNYTRFLVISRNDSLPSDNDKTSLLFSIKDKVGALHDVLSCVKKHGINLTKIESRPSKRKAWEYYFFVDCQGHKSSPVFKKALRELERSCIFVKVLGSYPKEI
ncbi:MAG: prephenate dehydratase [Candidatus Omnitrophota bacterium]